MAVEALRPAHAHIGLDLERRVSPGDAHDAVRPLLAHWALESVRPRGAFSDLAIHQQAARKQRQQLGRLIADGVLEIVAQLPARQNRNPQRRLMRLFAVVRHIDNEAPIGGGGDNLDLQRSGIVDAEALREARRADHRIDEVVARQPADAPLRYRDQAVGHLERQRTQRLQAGALRECGRAQRDEERAGQAHDRTHRCDPPCLPSGRLRPTQIRSHVSVSG